MNLRTLAVALTAAASLTAASPAHAAPTVVVSLAISAGTYAPTGAACSLVVEAGADGVAVLDAAVAAHCIVSYQAQTFPGFGTFVSCIDEVCGSALTGTTGTYWNMYENGVSTAYGADGFGADAGDELGFAYRAYCFEALCPSV
jgi:imidazole glycerol phosphate synthase subunit HisF